MNQDSIKQNEVSRPSKVQKINLLGAIRFLRKYWQFIASFVFLGLLGSAVYIVLTPNSYEASTQIRMAQISTSGAANPFGVSVEDPVSLIMRMQVPTNYSQEVIKGCEYEDLKNPALKLSKDIKFAPIKGVPNAVQFKLTASTPEIAKSCSMAVFEAIKSLQVDLTKVFVEEAKIKLATNDIRIEAVRKLIAKADQSGTAMSAAYLSSRDELVFYLTYREKMVDLINSVKNGETSLISPIYVQDRPASPKKASSVFFGLFLGGFLGLMGALIRQFKHMLSTYFRGG